MTQFYTGIIKILFVKFYVFGCHGNQPYCAICIKFICLVQNFSKNIFFKVLSIDLQ